MFLNEVEWQIALTLQTNWHGWVYVFAWLALTDAAPGLQDAAIPNEFAPQELAVRHRIECDES